MEKPEFQFGGEPESTPETTPPAEKFESLDNTQEVPVQNEDFNTPRDQAERIKATLDNEADTPVITQPSVAVVPANTINMSRLADGPHAYNMINLINAVQGPQLQQ